MTQELLDQIALCKENMRNIIDNAQAQERSLTDEEKELFEKNERQVKDIQAQLDTKNKEEKHEYKMNLRENLAKAIQSIANNRSADDCSLVIAGNSISLRTNETLETNIQAVQDEYRMELLEPLQNALLVDKLGIKVINTAKAVVMPSVNNVEASIEGEITALVGKKLEFSKAKVAPFRIGLSLPFSNVAIKEADMNLVSYAIQLCGKAEAQLINKVMFSNTAVNSKKGAFVDAKKVTGATSFANLVKLEGEVKKANVNIDGTAAYVLSPDVESTLKVTPKDAGSGRMVIEDGKINGYPYLVSNDVNGYVGFGVFSNFLIQKVGTPDMVVDNLSRSKENITEVNFNDEVAMQVIRQEAFVKLTAN